MCAEVVFVYLFHVIVIISGGSRPVLTRGAVLGPALLLEGHIQPVKKRQMPHSDMGINET